MKPRRLLFVAVPVLILLLPVGIFFADPAASDEAIARNVTVATVPVGGMAPVDAAVAVTDYETQLLDSNGVFTVNGSTFSLSPEEIGLTADVDAAVQTAADVHKDGGVLRRFVAWLTSFSRTEEVPLEISFDEEAVEAVLDAWEASAVANPAFPGSVAVIDGQIVTEYPRAGQAIDRDFARTQIINEMSRLDKTGVVVPVIDQNPTLTKAAIDAAAADMALLIDDNITLRSNEVGFRVTFTTDQLATAATAVVSEDKSEIQATFDPEVVLAILEPVRSEFEIEPINAQVDVNLETDEMTVIPGRSGTVVDVEGLIEEMRAIGLNGGTGNFPLLVGAEPELTTEEAQALTALKPLGGFTTDHPAGEPRVINIQTMADAVDGTVVAPGDDWSINDHVGERTEAKGYVAAPAIINGQPYCCDHPANIGGGVSQFGTTLFNAVFYSCLEDVEHRPHSLYFTRYPMGREATLGVPGPDVRFRNNTDSPVLIKTAYTDRSITVKMYGDNGGLECTDLTYEPTDVVEYEEELVADEEDVLKPGEKVLDRNGINGFLVKVDRIVTYPDGSQETDLKLAWRYQPLSKRYIVHPCEVTGEPIDCPVQLPSLVGKTWSEALAELEALGLLASRTDGFVDDPEKHDVIVTQDPAPGEWIPAGTTVKLTVGVYEEPSE